MRTDHFTQALDRAAVEFQLSCWVHIRVGTCTKEFKSFAYAFLRVGFAGMSQARRALIAFQSCRRVVVRDEETLAEIDHSYNVSAATISRLAP